MAYPFNKKNNGLKAILNNYHDWNWWKKVRQQEKQKHLKQIDPRPPAWLAMEALEPRILMSADLSYTASANELTLQFDQQANQFELLSIDDNSLVAAVDADAALSMACWTWMVPATT